MNDRVILWDLGNVVVKWSPETILRQLDYPDSLTACLRDSLFGHPDWLELDRGVKTETEVARRLVVDCKMSMQQAIRCFDVVRDTLVDIDHSVRLIEELAQSGTAMYVLSNMSRPNADYLRRREYFRHFNGVVISAEEKLNKPDTTLFERVLNRYSLTANRVLFIDDTAENTEAAKTLGMHTLLFSGSDECYAKIRQFADVRNPRH